ncbi:MAG: 3-hydroxyacyl-CoA dehydrogenase family protein [Dehalococcoidia bacterium]|nr:3-hydroxyacyl-CoA dehydrogenase family protein [Dehalococcoidia bacterium]
MKVERACVVGAGTMGHGIAQVLARSGIHVCLHDVGEDLVQAGLKKIEKSLNTNLERKKITREELVGTSSRLSGTVNLVEAVRDADFVIEAIIENSEAKNDVFRRLDEICDPRCIFATNTSYLSVTGMASLTGRPDRFVGMHWFNPPQVMRGIELVRTEMTSKETLDAIIELCQTIGKEAAVVKDSPGFIANRLLQAWRNESFRLYDENLASFQDIDRAFKTAYNFRMGPFELGDIAGLEIVLTGSETMYRETGREIFRPAQCVIKRVKAGDYGRKTGRGFYEYK